MNVSVRRASVDEVMLVSSVLNEANSWLRQRRAELWQRAELDPQAIAPEVAAGLYYLGFVENEVVGVLRLTLDDPLFWPEAIADKAAYVHRLAVRRAWSGGDTARALLTWAADEAARLGCAYLRLDCVASRPKLRAVYERFGFRYHSELMVGPYHVARYELPLRARRLH